jgi:hypothetical protein
MLSRHVPMLNWPNNLFAGSAAVEERQVGDKARTHDYLCDCGCNLSHNFAVSRLVGEQGNRIVLWYRTIGCRNFHAGIG